MLTIQLRRCITPETSGEQLCALCGARFHVGGVYAWPAVSDIHLAACPECIAYFGRRNPEHFPTLEEYEETARRYPEPILASEEEKTRLEQEDEEKAHEIYASGFIS